MYDYLREYFDFKALLICLGLVILGLLSVYSATFDVGAAAAFKKQLVWAAIGLLALFLMAFFNIKLASLLFIICLECLVTNVQVLVHGTDVMTD